MIANTRDTQPVQAPRPISLRQFLALLTPFTYFLRTGTGNAPKYDAIELALEYTTEEELEAPVIVAWNEQGTIATIVHAPEGQCGRDGSNDHTNDHAALNIVRKDAVPAMATTPKFTIIIEEPLF